MQDASNFSKLVPGFDFLQGLLKNAGAALPSVGQWVAPTLNAEELEKRIGELRTVQFWLEQNARMIGATIQALEVQRMTLSTLQSMNVQMEGLRDSLQIKTPPTPESASASAPSTEAAAAATAADKQATPDAPPGPGVVDPMQWWGALTKQFTELASTALKDTGAAAAQAGTTKAKAPAKRAARKAPAKSTATARKKAASKP